jgi:hypothetical protein
VSKPDVIVRTDQAGDEDKIVDLLVKGFNRWPHFDIDCSPRDHWNWKFIDNPAHKKQITLAEIDNVIVGCDHTLFNYVKIGDKTQECGQAVDSAVHPDYRGRGIYSKIRKYDEEVDHLESSNSNFVYSASSNPIIIKKEGEMETRPFPYLLVRLARIHDINLHLRNHDLSSKILLKTGYGAAKSVNSIGNMLSASKKSKSQFNIVNISRFDERVDPFWSKIKDNYNFILERSREYLNWRYCDHRGGNYVIRQAEEDGDIVGYIVFRVNRFENDYPTGFIVDLCTLSDRKDCENALIAEAVGYFDDLKVNVVNYAINKGHHLENRFKRFGFLDSRSNIYIGTHFNTHLKEFDELYNSPSDKLLLQFGDIDWI